MAEVICPENELIVIDKDQLLEKTMEMKHEKLRLSQACASYINGKFKTLKVVMEKDDAVSSITSIYPYATFYENEMTELFGCKIEYINIDYHNRLYRINETAPFLPKEAKEAKKEGEK